MPLKIFLKKVFRFLQFLSEFLAQRQKLDAELQKLTAEQERIAQTNTIDLEQPEWGRIQDALEEILDLSQPKPSPDLIRKFVTQVVPTGKTNFCWYLNLDGKGTTSLDMTVEGRKNHAALAFGGEHYAPQEENGIIDLKNACLCTTPHRLPLRAKHQSNYSTCAPVRKDRGAFFTLLGRVCCERMVMDKLLAGVVK